jgi:ribosomal protein S18 acetylase RimI-like enzyme
MDVRSATPADEPFLTAMLRHASSDFTEETRLTYVAGFGREGDFGVVADGEGAAWCRQIRGWGFVADDVPELTIGLEPQARGRGLGERLLRALLDMAAERGVRAVSLSVDPANAPAVALYERVGFERVGETDGHPTMLIRVSPRARA